MAWAGSTTGSTTTQKINKTAAIGSASAYMHVARAGSTWSLSTSGAGTSWTLAGSFSTALTVNQVGPFVANSGSPVPAYTALVDYVFDTSSPVIPEDGPGNPGVFTLTSWPSVPGRLHVPRQAVLAASESVSLTAVPGPGTTFAGWSGDASGTSTSTVVVMDTNKSVVGTFTAGTSSPAFVSDDFNRPSLGSTWSVVDPQGDGTVSMTGAGTSDARLSLSVPGGVAHDAFNTDNALRVMQPAANQDFRRGQVRFAAVGEVSDARFDRATGLRQLVAVRRPLDGDVDRGVGGVDDRIQDDAEDQQDGGDRIGIGVHARGAGRKHLDLVHVGQRDLVDAGRKLLDCAHGQPSRTVRGELGEPGAGVHHAGRLRVRHLKPGHPRSDPSALPHHQLTTSVVGNGSVSRSPDKPDYVEGEQVTLSAVPAARNQFTGWSGDVTGAQNPVVVVMNADKSVTANFATDTTPPVITNVVVTPSATSAVVTWTTNEPATSSVMAGPTTNYELGNFGSATLTFSHSVSVTGLQAATTYHYQVASTDGAGFTARGRTRRSRPSRHSARRSASGTGTPRSRVRTVNRRSGTTCWATSPIRMASRGSGTR